METLATDGAPKQRIITFFRVAPRFAQYTAQEIADGTDLPVKKITGAITALLKQEWITAEERDGTKYYRWTGAR